MSRVEELESDGVEETSQTQMSLIDSICLERDQEFEREIDYVRTVFSRKNREYADGISSTGLIGASVELFGAAQRLLPLVIRNKRYDEKMRQSKFQDTLRNVLVDLAVYSLIGLLMFRKKNLRGE